jgi:H+/Cl- antiporter ClcA
VSSATPTGRPLSDQIDVREPGLRDVDPRQTDVTQQSVGELIGRVTGDMAALVRSEIQLARTEITQEVRQAGKAAAAGSAAALAGWMTALFLSLALMWWLNAALPLGWAALIVAAVWAVVAAITWSISRSRMRRVGAPQQTVESIKEDVRWARERSS